MTIRATYAGTTGRGQDKRYYFNVAKTASLYGTMDDWRAEKAKSEALAPYMEKGYWEDAASSAIYHTDAVEREEWAIFLARYRGRDGEAAYCWALSRSGSPNRAQFQIWVDRREVAEAFAAKFCEPGTVV